MKFITNPNFVAPKAISAAEFATQRSAKSIPALLAAQSESKLVSFEYLRQRGVFPPDTTDTEIEAACVAAGLVVVTTAP